MATQSLPSRVYGTGRNQNGYMNPAFSGSLEHGGIKMATYPYPLGVPNLGEESKIVHSPCRLGVPRKSHQLPRQKSVFTRGETPVKNLLGNENQ